MRVIAATLALLSIGTARAQGVDGHGEVPPAFDPNPRAPLAVQAPSAAPAGSWSMLGLLEYADAPVVQYRQVTETRVEELVLLDDVVSIDLAGRYVLVERFGLAATLPVFIGSSGQLGTGPALGDLHLWAPVGLVLPDLRTGDGFGLSLVPSLTVPTGAQDALLGDEGFGIGLSAVTGYSFGPLSADLNLGLARSSAVELPNQRVGGGAVAGGFAVGLHPVDSWSLHWETRWNSSTNDANTVEGTPGGTGGSAGNPTETFLTFKTHLPGRAWGAAGAGAGTNTGIGAARLRAWLGVGLHHTPEADEAELELRTFTLRALDPAGVPVPGATLWVGDKQVGTAEGDGLLALRDPAWRKEIEVRGPHHEAVAVVEPGDPEVRALDVTLPWLPFEVPVRVQDQQGQRVEATLSATRSDDPDGPVVTGTGDSLSLTPGNWRLSVEADGFGVQARTVVVESSHPPDEVEVVLLESAGPAMLRISLRDPEGEPVEGARVLLDGQPLGTSGGGGVLEVHDVSVGDHSIAVLHENFTRTEEPELALIDGENSLPLVLRRVPGSVKVIATGPNGVVVPDAVVRFDGPSRLPPAPLGTRGERIQTLSPGDWSLMVTSAEFGVQQRSISVPPDSWELIVVEVVLQPGEQGDATLALRVVDAGGGPLDGVSVLLDDRELGTTSTGGALRLIGLQTGSRSLTVRGEHFRPVEPVDLFLVEGLQEHVVALDWKAGTVRVTARHPEGAVPDMVLRWFGPEQRSPSPLGPAGDSTFQVAPGEWTILGTSEVYGFREASLEVAEDSRLLHRVDLRMNPDEGGLADLSVVIVDTEGAPVSGAEIRLDGTLVGTTTNTGQISLKNLSVGSRQVQVRSPLHVTVDDRVVLAGGEQTHDVVLKYKPGAARINVVSGGSPVGDAVVRMVGPSPTQPAPVDRDGRQMFALTPGTWQAVAVSAQAGIGQGTLDIAEDQVGLALLEIDIETAPSGTAALLVRVLDPDGQPVSAAEVQVNGSVVGTTGPGGALLAEGLPLGPADLTASHPGFTASQPVDATLLEGAQERILQLDWRPAGVEIAATDAQGQPVDARIQLVGPVDHPAIDLGEDGVGLVELRPGEWQVIASTDTLGPSRSEIKVTGRGATERVELVLEASRVSMTRQAVVIKEQVQFEFGKAALTRDSGPVLDEVANAILGNPGIIRVEVQGHTDAIGEVAYNQQLSQQRAEAVLRALRERDVPPEKLVARGYGTQRPIADNETEDGRALNRRVEFDIVEQANASEP